MNVVQCAGPTSLLFLVFLVLIGWCTPALSECNVCQSNGAACINQTSFNLCFGGTTPYTTQTFTCQDGLECTDLPNICFQIGGWTPACVDQSKCGVCNQKNVFACTGRTTFAFCFGSTTPSDVLGTCPTGYVCDYSSDNICVPKDKATTNICESDTQIV